MKQRKNAHVDLDNVRLPEQQQVMERIAIDEQCPFCEEHLATYHNLPILKRGTFWLLTENQWPYAHTRVHLLAIYRHHAENLTEIAPAAGAELLALLQWAAEEFQVEGGGIVLRFGDTQLSAGSVQHIHAQLVSPDLDDPDYEPVRIKIGKSPSKLER